MVEIVVESVDQVKEPAPVSPCISTEYGVSRPTGVYVLAYSSLLLRSASCGTGDNPRFFTEELFAASEGISGYNILTGQSVLSYKPRALFGSFQIASV